MTNTTETLVAAVIVHAKAHYDTDGWDVVVECYEFGELAEVIGADCLTVEEAIRRVKAEVSDYADVRSDIRAEVF